MIRFEDITALLLCAGLSRRFGEADKLTTPLSGRPLLCHSAGLLAAIPFRRRLAVVRTDAAENGVAALLGSGFSIIENPASERGKDHSIRLGIAEALRDDPAVILLCLGDMPYIDEKHLAALAAAADRRSAAVSVSAEGWHSPPVLIPRFLAETMLERSDRTTNAVLAGYSYVVRVPAGAACLADFDTMADFEAAA